MEKLIKLLKQVETFSMRLSDNEYDMVFTDAYGEHHMIDNSLDSLFDRALSVSEISNRSAERWKKEGLM